MTKKAQYEKPEILFLNYRITDIIRTSNQSGTTDPSDNDIKQDIGEWDTEL